jgi:hypothetical protein
MYICIYTGRDIICNSKAYMNDPDATPVITPKNSEFPVSLDFKIAPTTAPIGIERQNDPKNTNFMVHVSLDSKSGPDSARDSKILWMRIAHTIANCSTSEETPIPSPSTVECTINAPQNATILEFRMAPLARLL